MLALSSLTHPKSIRVYHLECINVHIYTGSGAMGHPAWGRSRVLRGAAALGQPWQAAGFLHAFSRGAGVEDWPCCTDTTTITGGRGRGRQWGNSCEQTTDPAVIRKPTSMGDKFLRWHSCICSARHWTCFLKSCWVGCLRCGRSVSYILLVYLHCQLGDYALEHHFAASLRVNLLHLLLFFPSY
jgi:hypothetical protein